jgi:hypothetical protein
MLPTASEADIRPGSTAKFPLWRWAGRCCRSVAIVAGVENADYFSADDSLETALRAVDL